MLTLLQLKTLAKENNIHYTFKKDEIAKLLIDNNIITPSDLTKPKDKSKYEYLKSIRNNPKTVEIFDKETGETSTFPSIHKTPRALGISSVCIKDGKICKNRYIITVK